MMRATVIAIFAVVFLNQPAQGDTAPPAYTDAQVQRLVQAVRAIPTDHKFVLDLSPTAASNLPAWDPMAHYAGPFQLADGRTAYKVLIDIKYSPALNNLSQADHKVGAAIASAVFLADIDAGRAGSDWKSLYDAAAAADTNLPASVVDRCTNRHALVATLADSKPELYSIFIGHETQSMDQFGYPLSQPIDYGSGLIGDARLGVGAARLVELLEYSDALRSASTQDFVDKWFARFGMFLPREELRRQLATMRPLFAVNQVADRVENETRFANNMLFLVQHLKRDEIEAFGVGYDANDLRYNAVAVKNADEDKDLRKLVATSPVLDSTIPDLKDLRLRLGALNAGDWSTVADLSGQIVKKLVP